MHIITCHLNRVTELFTRGENGENATATIYYL
jgi:hypothetical protein